MRGRTLRVTAGLCAETDAHDVSQGLEHPLGQQQPKGELEVVSRGPHHDRKRGAPEQELKRLLGGDLIALCAPAARTPARDRDRRRLRTYHRQMLGAGYRWPA